MEGTICKQLLSSLKAKFSSFIYFRFLIIISSSFFLFLHFVSCLCVCNIFVCLHLLRILMNLLLICVRYICRLHWPHGVLVLLPAPVHDSARSSSSDSRDSFVADICRCFCEICASLLIKNCVYLHICIPCHAPNSLSTLSLHLSSDSVCLLSVARSLNVATSSKIRRACPLPSLPQLGSMRHADLALISRDFNESRLTSQKAKPEPCNLRRAPCTLHP